MRIGSQIANIHARASIESEMTSQALPGERVKVLNVDNRWSQIQVHNDGYNGFVESRHLVDDASPGTHRVIAKHTPLFTNPDIKSPVKQLVPVASELTLHKCEDDRFLCSEQQHYVWKQHVSNIVDKSNGKLVDTAQALFSGSPYLWGGRSPLGLDCSALVQLCARLHGWYLPRDTAEQIALFRDGSHCSDYGQSTIQPDCKEQIDYAQRQTDDLVYWPGHVAIVLDNETVVHATAHSLHCCNEPLDQIEARAGKPESIWRLL